MRRRRAGPNRATPPNDGVTLARKLRRPRKRGPGFAKDWILLRRNEREPNSLQLRSQTARLLNVVLSETLRIGGGAMIRILLVSSRWLAPLRGAVGCKSRTIQLPTGAYPHDVAPAPDGTVWFTGQQPKALLGRFDPGNGQAREDSARPRRGAAWRDRRARRRRLAHRRRPERDRARRSGRPTRSSCFRCRRNFRDANLNTRSSTRPASSGSPARAASMAGSIRRPARSTPGRRRAVAAPTASR